MNCIVILAGEPKMKLHHIMLRVYNIEKSLDFYQNILGLNVLSTLELPEAKLYYIGKDETDVTLELCYNYCHPEKYTHGSHFGHVSYKVDSLNELEKKLNEYGLNFERPPFQSSDGCKIAQVKDPDGHLIEFFECI